MTPGAAIAGLGELHYYGLDGQRLSDRMDVQANIADGNLVLHGRDLQIAGTGLNLIVDRYYNSLNAANSAGSDFGPGWSMGTGRDVNLTVNGDGSVTFTGPSGYEVTFTQSGGSYVTPTGLDATLVQNGDGTFTLTWHKNGERFQFNSSGVFTSDVDKNGNTISFAYNPDGTLNEITDTQGRVVNFAYTSQNGVQLISQMTDSTGRAWKYGYDPTTNELTTYTDPNNKQTTYTYGGPSGLLSQVTDPNNNGTGLSYDATSLEVTEVHFADGSRHDYTYNAGSTIIKDANNNPTTYAYDSLGRVTGVTDAQSHSTSTTYTADSNVATFTDAKSKTTTFGYDSSGEKLQSVAYPTGATASWAYNDANHPFYPTSSTDTQGNTLTHSYDPNGNQLTTTDQLSSQNQFSATYNTNGTVHTTTDARGNSTSYGYDTHGNLTGITPPAPLGAIAISPDALSRVHSRTDGKGQTTTYTYDNLDRVTNIVYQDGSSIAYTPDNDGNVTAMTDSIGTTTYQYDGLNRQFQKVPPDKSSVNYRYDFAGNLAKVVTCGPAQVWGGQPDGGFIGGTCVIGGGPGGGIIGGRETDYAYNTLNELTSLTDKSDNTTTSFGYDANHNRTTITYPNGVTQTSTYDDSQRIAGVVASKSGNTLTSFTYSYINPANSHDTFLQYSEAAVISGTATTTSNTYDVVNRLSAQSLSGGVAHTYQYTYDGDGNRTQQVENGSSTTTYAYNAANEITQAGTLTYTFDADGNELTNSAGLSFTYNAKNQTSNVTAPPPGSVSLNMSYTGPDQSQRLTAGNSTYNYTFLGLYSETNNGAPQPNDSPSGTTYYTRDNEGLLLSEATPNGKYYYLYDGMGLQVDPPFSAPGTMGAGSAGDGSVRGVTDSSGSLVDAYVYCSSGNKLSATGTAPNALEFQGGYLSDNEGLYFGNGLFDYSIDRWNQLQAEGFRGGFGYVSGILTITPSLFQPGQPGVALVESGIGVFIGAQHVVVAGFLTTGGIEPGAASQGFAVGAYAGAGAGEFNTNATSPEQIGGPFETTGIASALGSTETSTGGGIKVSSFNVGPGVGGGAYAVPSNTTITAENYIK